MTLTLEAKEPVAEDAVRLRLVSGNSRRLPSFDPGAHVELAFSEYRRRYSLTSSPAETTAYEVIVLRARPGRGGSAFIHDRLLAGAAIEVSTPINSFPLEPVARHHVFFAGGIGLTPFYTMADAATAAGGRFHLHYVTRSEARALPTGAFGRSVTRYVGPVARREFPLPDILDAVPSDAALYVCGPTSLVEDVRAAMRARGWDDGRLRLETFGSGVHPQDRPIAVHLVQSGLSLQVAPGTSILDALLGQGVFVGAGCRRGECGACVVDVVAGDVDHRDVCLTPEQRRGAMCTCVSWARSPEVTLAL